MHANIAIFSNRNETYTGQYTTYPFKIIGYFIILTLRWVSIYIKVLSFSFVMLEDS